MTKAIVFYDHKCGLCKKEILFYKKKDTKNLIDWLDIHTHKNKLIRYDLSFDQAMRSFHFISPNLIIYTGVNAFIQIYKTLPGWNILAKIISFPGIYHLSLLGYKLFAVLRYRFHGYHKCEI